MNIDARENSLFSFSSGFSFNLSLLSFPLLCSHLYLYSSLSILISVFLLLLLFHLFFFSLCFCVSCSVLLCCVCVVVCACLCVLEERRRVYASNTSTCVRSKRPPCVHSKRPLVCRHHAHHTHTHQTHHNTTTTPPHPHAAHINLMFFTKTAEWSLRLNLPQHGKTHHVKTQ